MTNLSPIALAPPATCQIRNLLDRAGRPNKKLRQRTDRVRAVAAAPRKGRREAK